MATSWVRSARADEAATIVDIIRGAFPQGVIERTVYGCVGVTEYVRAAIDNSILATPTFLVAGTATAVLAAAEVAVAGDGVFLSYIATRPAARSQGLGSSLLLASAELSQAGGYSVMTLDVLSENSRASEWYGAIGFEAVGERGWWELELSAPSVRAALVAGWPQSEVCHASFGFSEVTLLADGRAHYVGRLGTEWFRITSLAALENEKVIAALATMDPRRRILALAALDASTASRLGAPALRYLRLRAPLATLRQRLAPAGT